MGFAFLSLTKFRTLTRNVNLTPPLGKFILHPLIHTLLEVTLVQNAVGVQVNEVEKENPHRHGARKPMGDPTIERVNPMFTPVNL